MNAVSERITSPVEEILDELRAGRMVIVTDEEDRENEGDLLIAAQFCRPEHINFMASQGRGLICLTLTQERCEYLHLPPMVSQKGYGTNFTVSIEAAHGVGTGISAKDRARTIQVAVDSRSTPEDLVRPGHVFPLSAREGGVLVRPGHTEAGCDLTRLAGLVPAAAICEVLREDGEMARLPDLALFALRHGLKIGTIRDLLRLRLRQEMVVREVGSRPLSTPFGRFSLVAFDEVIPGMAHLALVRGHIGKAKPWVHLLEVSSAMDFLEHPEENPKEQGVPPGVYPALKKAASAEAAVVVLLDRERDAQSLLASISAPAAPLGTQPRSRALGIGMQILKALGVRQALFSREEFLAEAADFGIDAGKTKT